jgi:hypothetical protein
MKIRKHVKWCWKKNVCTNFLKCSFGDDMFPSFKSAQMEGYMPTLPKKEVHTNLMWDRNGNEP